MITYAVMSKKGGRAVNEDSVGVKENRKGFYFVAADGLGGHGQGEVASQLAVKTILSVADLSDASGREWMETAICEAHKQILEEQKRQGLLNEMKTTVTVLHISGERAQWAYAGDSRIYQFKKGKLLGRTMDHSVPQMLVNQGVIKEKDIRGHEDRNRLIRVIGNQEDKPKFDVSDHISAVPDTSFLLCSDGFWELIEEKEMCRLLKASKTPEAWIQAMEEVVLSNGKNSNMDNYSAVAVFVRN